MKTNASPGMSSGPLGEALTLLVMPAQAGIQQGKASRLRPGCKVRLGPDLRRGDEVGHRSEFPRRRQQENLAPLLRS
jgi:hypothetical protein